MKTVETIRMYVFHPNEVVIPYVFLGSRDWMYTVCVLLLITIIIQNFLDHTER